MTHHLKILCCCCLLALLSACASNPQQSSSAVPVDKFEGFNRAMFSFNMTLDRWVLKPVAKGYDYVLPEFAKVGVSNFFGNLGEINNVVNDGLQWKWKSAGVDSSRFLVNSTIGVLGLFDVASKMGLEKSDGEDFGQTLAHWGVKSGPYLVLPFLGPSSIRDGVGTPLNWAFDPVLYVDSMYISRGLAATRIVDDRADLLEVEELASGDLYVFMRDAYLQRREYLINDGEVEDDFGDEDW